MGKEAMGFARSAIAGGLCMFLDPIFGLIMIFFLCGLFWLLSLFGQKKEKQSEE